MEELLSEGEVIQLFPTLVFKHRVRNYELLSEEIVRQLDAYDEEHPESRLAAVMRRGTRGCWQTADSRHEPPPFADRHTEAHVRAASAPVPVDDCWRTNGA